MGTAEKQGELWSKIPRDWSLMQEPLHAPLWEAMLDSGLVSPGKQMLDAGCGGGGASLLAAERGALVSGLDAAQGLIAFARKRLPSADFRVGDLENLPFEDESFDTVFAANAVQYSGDRITTLQELGRVCKAEGKIVASLFASAEKVRYSAIFKVLREIMPKPPKGGGPFELSGTGILEGLFKKAGLQVLETIEVDCPFLYSDFEMFWRANIAAGPMQAILRIISEEKVKSSLQNAVDEFRLPDGKILIGPNIFKYVVATR